jgi:hypothetical protein
VTACLHGIAAIGAEHTSEPTVVDAPAIAPTIPPATAYGAPARPSCWARLLRSGSLPGSLLLTVSIFGPKAIVAAPTSNIRLVTVPIVTGAPPQSARLPWKSSRCEVRRIAQGALWAATDSGIDRFDRATYMFRTHHPAT